MPDDFKKPQNMRIPDITASPMTPEQQQVVDAVTNGPRGRLAGPMWAWLYSPELGLSAQQVGAYIRFGSSLPRPLNELAILLTGRHWNSQFEFYAHTRLGIAAGLDAEKIEQIRQGKRPDTLSPDEALVYDCVETLLKTHRLPDALYASLEARFGVQGAVDLVGAVGYYCMVSLTLNTFRILPEPADMPFPEPPPSS